ncbi:MAG: TrlF family AAA-like ATPase [Dehalococcoidia bacterium]|jgi:hypothetical protein
MHVSQMNQGLIWRKIDLHVHTPASKNDYTDSQIKPSDIVNKCRELNLDAVCITDHNSGDWIDLVKEAAGNKPVVFPGVEITAQGGLKNIHVLAILDPSKGTKDIDAILTKVNITEKDRGTRDALADGDLNKLFRIITESEGIPLLAHADSDSGVLNDMRGITRIKIIQNSLLLGAQIVKDETVKFLDGSDRTYKRKLATFKASDAHGINDIGRSVSFFKMGELNIASLKQCLFDPDTRIKRQMTVFQHPLIYQMEFSQGFLQDQTCRFHNGLNSVIGGKGVGKSLIIEFLRFALDYFSPIKYMREDMLSKLKEQLGLGGEVNVYIQSQSGTQYKITREYDGITNPITITKILDNQFYEGDLRKLFPILVYSQNEVIEIARDQAAQLALIDNFIDIEQYNSVIDALSTELKSNSNQYLEALMSKQVVIEIKKEIATIKEKIKELDKVLKDPMFTSKKKWDHKKSIIESLNNDASGLYNLVKKSLANLKSIKFQSLSAADKEQEELKLYSQAIQEAKMDLIKGIQNESKNLDAKISQAHRYIQGFNQNFTAWKTQYDDFISKSGGHRESTLAREREKYEGRLGELQADFLKNKEKAASFNVIDKKRKEFLNSLEIEAQKRFDSRKVVYDKLTKATNNRIKLSINKGGNKSAFLAMLINLAYGTRIRTQNLESIATSMEPGQFSQFILKKDLTTLCNRSGLDIATITKLVDAICSNDQKLNDVLDLAFSAMPEDVPDIQYLKDDGKYYPLNQISVGQKCTALLSIALSEGSIPIIIDQPEDALDVTTVYYDVVSLLRKNKEDRQFILTTHNPNIAVSSDSDKYHILKASQSNGEIVCCGAIDLDYIRDMVINHMEGGIDPYKLRGKKYNLTST